MREATLRWIGRGPQGNLGFAVRLPNDHNEKSHVWDALEAQGYSVKETHFYPCNHEDYPGYKVVEAVLEDDEVITMYASDVASA